MKRSELRHLLIENSNYSLEFSLAIAVGKADSNPCVRVKKFKLDNERYRYLDPAKEAALMETLVASEPTFIQW